jgi:ribosomal protein S18 acetylase RimI-like enzyme
MIGAVIRRASAGDIPLLIELTDEIQALHAKVRPDLFIYPQDRSAVGRHFEQIFASEDKHVLLLEVGGQVEGHLIAEIRRVAATAFTYPVSYLFIHQIGVRTAAQRRGHGQQLMTAASDLARGNDLSEIRLDYWSFNEPACRFYAKSGFQVVREFASKNL